MLPSTVKLGPPYDPGLFSYLEGQIGVYVFFFLLKINQHNVVQALGLPDPSNVVNYAVTGKPHTAKDGKQYIFEYKYYHDYQLSKVQYDKRRAWHKAQKQQLKAK